jgi:Tfp pilus assembly protein PilF
MLSQQAEQSFQQGIEFLSRGQARDALAYFGGAIEIETHSQPNQLQSRYLSYYGLCLGLTGGDLHEAIQRCRQAVKSEGYRSDVCWNLGRVLFIAGRRRQAYNALQRGLQAQPGHPGILRDLRRMGIRRRPVIPFLNRGSKVNIFLGRILRAA